MSISIILAFAPFQAKHDLQASLVVTGFLCFVFSQLYSKGALDLGGPPTSCLQSEEGNPHHPKVFLDQTFGFSSFEREERHDLVKHSKKLMIFKATCLSSKDCNITFIFNDICYFIDKSYLLTGITLFFPIHLGVRT